MQNGQDVRVVIDGKPRRFTVQDVIFEDDNRDLVTRNGIARDASRWRELLIVRTALGAVAIRSAYRTRWQGEHGSECWMLVQTDDEAAQLLARAAGTSDAIRGEDRHAAGVADGDDIEPALARRALKALDWWDRVAEEA